MNMDKTVLKKFLGSLLADILGDLIGTSLAFNHFVPHPPAGAPASAPSGKDKDKAAAANNAAAPTDSMPNVSAGGLFNLSDQVAFATLIARLETDETNMKMLGKITRFLTTKLTYDQQRKFRVVVGKAAQYKHANCDGDVNYGIKFLEVFASLNDKQRLELCQAMGVTVNTVDVIGEILTSPMPEPLQKMGEWLKKRVEAHPRHNPAARPIGVPVTRKG